MSNRNILIVFSVGSIAIIGILCVLYFSYLLNPSSVEGEKKFTVREGEGLQEIAKELREMNLIRSAGAFKLYSLFSGSAHTLKPGEYTIKGTQTTPEIVGLLVIGVPEDVSVLIVEGSTLKEIDKKLTSLGIVPLHSLENFPVESLRGEYSFLGDAKTLEGFLFPDTYRFFLKSTPENVVRRFLDNWQKSALPLFVDSSEVLYDTLTKASIIEKEVPNEGEQPIVADILNKRLRQGIPLQVDATVIYAKCQGEFKNCSPLIKKDFKIDSSFNTYRKIGLPPSPISNPGLLSLKAALHPVSSKFLYYLSDPVTKKTIFSETLDEQNANIVEYLR